jgi:hypothetical protein
MLYAILCYNEEAHVGSWSKEHDDAVMDQLARVERKLTKEGRLGPVARLMPTGQAATLRKGDDAPFVVDGPFAETKEQLLGFYLVESASMDEAMDAARDLAAANPGPGCYEVRPVMLYHPPASAAR